MATWWSRYPAALAREKHALDERGFSWSADEEAFAKGRLVINLQVSLGGVERQLTAYYPDTYPYFAPQVVMRGKLLLAACPELEKALNAARRGEVLFGGIVYRDEVSWRANKDDWVFLRYEVAQERRGARNASYRLNPSARNQAST